jgi:2'-5' RNA ligase
LQIYDKLWNDAVSAFERGEPQIDSYLSDKANDLRRGVTIIFRPSPSVGDAVVHFIRQLAGICPDQYFYRPEELHVTVLSIISGTEFWQREFGRVGDCRRIISDVMRRHRSFKINFRGITASPASVMIQGFPTGDGLAAIRDDLRMAFGQNGLGDMPDRRYKITGAHMTIMRFRKLCPDSKRLAAFLKESRERNFGESKIVNIQLTLADWYSSADTVQTLQEYRLMT